MVLTVPNNRIPQERGRLAQAFEFENATQFIDCGVNSSHCRRRNANIVDVQDKQGVVGSTEQIAVGSKGFKTQFAKLRGDGII